MGAGLEMEPGDIAFKVCVPAGRTCARCRRLTRHGYGRGARKAQSNFATLNLETGIVETRRADRNFEGLGPSLCAALNGLYGTEDSRWVGRLWPGTEGSRGGIPLGWARLLG